MAGFQARIQASPILHLNGGWPVTLLRSAEIENDALMPQIRVLAELGQVGDLRLFMNADAQVYSSRQGM